MPIVDVRGVNHYYEWIRRDENAHKPVMVFIHGWGGSSRYWRSTAEAIADDFDCLLYDLRGFGRSSLPQDTINSVGFAMEDYADDLAILLDNLNLKQIYLNAHSMGASLATFFLNRYSDRVQQAILTCNGIFEYNALAFAAFHKAGGYVVKFRYNWFLKFPFADRMFMARFLHRPIPKSDRLAFLEDFLLADRTAAAGTIYTSVSKEAVETMPIEFAKLTVPTLMVSGEKDIIIPAKMGQQAAALNEQIEYVELAKTAHFPMLEDKPAYLNTIRKFLQIGSAVARSS